MKYPLRPHPLLSMLTLFFMCILSLGGGVSAEADPEDSPLRLTLSQFVVVKGEGEEPSERLVPFDGQAGAPGTVIEYQLIAKNASDQAVGDVLLRLLVPEGTRYVESSEKLDRTAILLQFSIDRGQTFRTAPIRYWIEQENGDQVQVVATPDMYTHLRLVFLRPIAPGEEVTFAYRVAVE